ncbi:hypothetical protein ENBRE01_2901 [Enteropsectra breve]|nr:hypothetical protein ENBRE01_2901 [Enteropsectra breve]
MSSGEKDPVPENNDTSSKHTSDEQNAADDEFIAEIEKMVGYKELLYSTENYQNYKKNQKEASIDGINEEITPDNIKINSDNINTAPDNINITSYNINRIPDNMNETTDNINTALDNINTAPDNINITSNNMNTAPDDMNTTPDNINTTLDNIKLNSDINLDINVDKGIIKGNSENIKMDAIEDFIEEYKDNIKLDADEDINAVPDSSPSSDIIQPPNSAVKLLMPPAEEEMRNKQIYISEQDRAAASQERHHSKGRVQIDVGMENNEIDEILRNGVHASSQMKMPIDPQNEISFSSAATGNETSNNSTKNDSTKNDFNNTCNKDNINTKNDNSINGINKTDVNTFDDKNTFNTKNDTKNTIDTKNDNNMDINTFDSVSERYDFKKLSKILEFFRVPDNFHSVKYDSTAGIPDKPSTDINIAEDHRYLMYLKHVMGLGKKSAFRYMKEEQNALNYRNKKNKALVPPKKNTNIYEMDENKFRITRIYSSKAKDAEAALSSGLENRIEYSKDITILRRVSSISIPTARDFDMLKLQYAHYKFSKDFNKISAFINLNLEDTILAYYLNVPYLNYIDYPLIEYIVEKEWGIAEREVFIENYRRYGKKFNKYTGYNGFSGGYGYREEAEMQIFYRWYCGIRPPAGWEKEERVLFADAILRHKKNWEKIADVLKPRTVEEVRAYYVEYYKKLTDEEREMERLLVPSIEYEDSDE